VLVAVRRLTEAGATVVAEHELDGRGDHVVMADPEGNEFCVV
jgi:predicted enzyme related to lactoylglutathione lyase